MADTTTPQRADAGPLPTALLREFDVPGPRYTSYPTADRFVEAFGADDARRAMQQRAEGVGMGTGALSIYVHIPFCEALCYYCACNKIITKHHERATEYLQALAQETSLVAASLGERQPVCQLHFGGGSPTFLSDDELGQVMAMLRTRFRVQADAEVSIEVDPRTVTAERLRRIRDMGFNRLSFGMQDFDPAVQQAVHRVQPFEQVRELMVEARALGFQSINADLIYGLPKQTPESFARTLAQTAELRPDRIALYCYAHLPERFKPQRRIDVLQLPSAEQRLSMLNAAIGSFLAHGYTYIGMDHFALHDDPLAVAKRQGRLHRNFQGYSTQPDCDLIALGVSAIGKVGPTYYQNAKTLPEYYDALRQHQLPVVRGIALSRDDLVRRAVIMALMCQGRIEFESIELAHLISMKTYFAPEFKALEPLAKAGLVEIDDEAIQVTAAGWYVVRAVAMTFDKFLRETQRRERFSRVI